MKVIPTVVKLTGGKSWSVIFSRSTKMFLIPPIRSTESQSLVGLWQSEISGFYPFSKLIHDSAGREREGGDEQKWRFLLKSSRKIAPFGGCYFDWQSKTVRPRISIVSGEKSETRVVESCQNVPTCNNHRRDCVLVLKTHAWFLWPYRVSSPHIVQIRISKKNVHRVSNLKNSWTMTGGW